MGKDTQVYGDKKGCPSCGNQVQASESSCPYCGHHFTGRKPTPFFAKKSTIILGSLLTLGIFIGIVFAVPSLFRPYLEPIPVVGPIMGRKIPDFTFNYSPSSPLLGEKMTFDASNLGHKTRFITEYKWDFNGDGRTEATGSTVKHKFTTSGPQVVKVTAFNQQGNRKSVTRRIAVRINVVRKEVLRVPIVWGDKEWQDCGVQVEEGDRIKIEAISGKWDPGTHVPWGEEDEDILHSCGPEGYSWKTKDIFMGTIRGREPKYPFASLIGRLGGEVFYVGEERGPFYTDQSGRLYLAMNDQPNQYDDNSGLVAVSIKRESGSSGETYPRIRINIGASGDSEDYIVVPIQVESSTGLAEVSLNGDKELLDETNHFSKDYKLYPGTGASKIVVRAVNLEGKAAKSSLVVDSEIIESHLGKLDY